VHATADKLVPGFEHLPKLAQAAVVYVVTELIEEKGSHYLLHYPSAADVVNMLVSEIAIEKKWNLGAAAYNYITSQTQTFEGYHGMTMVIRGEIEHGECPPDYKIGNSLPSRLRYCEDTQLAFDVTTDHFPDYELAVLRNGKTVSTTTNTLPPQSLLVSTGASAATLPDVFRAEKIGDTRGSEPVMNELWLATQYVEPGAQQAAQGTTVFSGTPNGAPFCIGAKAATPATRCYTWLDSSP
jgi:hypothetical protein